MDYRIFRTPVAVQDLRVSAIFISQDNPAVAERVSVKLIEEAEAMALFPFSGRMLLCSNHLPLITNGDFDRYWAECQALLRRELQRVDTLAARHELPDAEI